MNNPTNNTETAASQSIYSLLVREEEKQRNVFETAIYALFVLCAVLGMWQFAQQQPVPVLNHISNEQATLAVNVCTDGEAVC